MNDKNDQPAWATDPRGLPLAVLDRDGRIWLRARAQDTYFGETPVRLERDYGPCIPLWPDTPPTSPLPDMSHWHPVPVGVTIPAGTEYAYRPGRSIYFNSAEEGTTQYVSDEQRYTEHPIPDPNAWATDRIGLWSDTPPTPIDPAEIKVGMRVRRVWGSNSLTLTSEGVVEAATDQHVTLDYCEYFSEGCEWFLIADAPDDDAHWIRAIAEATPETAATVYAAIKGEQA